MARVVAEKLSGALGQQVVVDNRAGGSGLVGTRTFIKSAPDGYTLFLGHTGSISINPSLYANAGFDPRKDFAPIGLIASMPVALLAHPSFPAKTIGDVVAIAKKEGRQVQYRDVGGRHRRLSLRRVVQVHHRHRRRHHPLQGHGSGHERPSRQSRADCVRGVAAGARQPAGRHVAGDCGAQPHALQSFAGCSDRERVRFAGLRIGPALRTACTRGHAAADHRPPQHGVARAGGDASRSSSASWPKAAIP